MASAELKTVLELVGSADLGSLTLQERRALMASGAPPPAGTQVEPVDADGVPAEWVTAAGVSAGPAVLYFHGGAYHLGSPARLRGLLGLLSAAAQTRVLSAGYRLAPEHPFPAALQDALTAYRWLIASGTPARQVVIGGDSSGGGLALAALVALRDAGEPLPGAAVVLSPWTDLAMGGESLRSRAAVDALLTPDGYGRRRTGTWPAGSPAPLRLAALRRPARPASGPDPGRGCRDRPRRLHPVRRGGTGRGGRRDAGDLAGDAARLARVRRAAPGGRRGGRADRPLAAGAPRAAG